MKTQEKLAEQEKTVKPKNKFVIFPITITEWENEGISSYTIQKSYKDGADWKNTSSFSEADLCIIGKILNKI
jgi:hypothetical protein